MATGLLVDGVIEVAGPGGPPASGCHAGVIAGADERGDLGGRSLPGDAVEGELAELVDGPSSDAVAWQSAGVALLTAAVVLAVARQALERADL